MTNPEFSFIQLSDQMADGCLFIPVKIGSDISFFTTIETGSKDISKIEIVSETGNYISDVVFDKTNVAGKIHVKITSDLSLLIAPNNYFRLLVTSSDGQFYSNILKYLPDTEYSLVEYSCDNDEFGFSFSLGKTLTARLPILMDKPQLPQDDKVYTTSNGERKVLYASINKEWSCTTEYFDESMHEKILVALSCDHLLIDGISVVKSDKYEIEWDNYTENECNQKIAMATFKVQQNRTIRNSNCG